MIGCRHKAVNSHALKNGLSSSQGIAKVTMMKRTGYKARTLKIEVRIGNTALSPSYGAKQITANSKCGITSSSAQNSVESFTCSPPLDGRYASLQSFANAIINIAEVIFYTSGECIDALDFEAKDYCGKLRDFSASVSSSAL